MEKRIVHTVKTNTGKVIEMYQELTVKKCLVITFDGKQVSHKFHYANYAGAWSIFLNLTREHGVTWSDLVNGASANV